jgi:hypothetical protein
MRSRSAAVIGRSDTGMHRIVDRCTVRHNADAEQVRNGPPRNNTGRCFSVDVQWPTDTASSWADSRPWESERESLPSHSPREASMKLSECVIEQYRGARLVRSFNPSGDAAMPWRMEVNGRSYRRTNGWVLSKVLVTLVDGSPFRTRVVPIGTSQTTR